jgi:hypothetical protein
VRAEAVKSLGRFIYASEMGHFIEKYEEEVQELLFTVFQKANEDPDVRRFALESLAHCTHSELPRLIQEAYTSPDDAFRLSAVVAMGRSCDRNRWENQVLRELDSNDEDMRREAARASGELQLMEAVPSLIQLLKDSERDDQEVVIWALGEIGGREATRVLENLAEAAEESGDQEFAALIDDALGNASLANGDLMMLDFGHEE